MLWFWMFYELIFFVNYMFIERSFILFNLKFLIVWYSNEFGGIEVCVYVYMGYDIDLVM